MARQHNGRLGKEDNCQVGVFLVGVTPAGSALLDHQLFLPEPWYEPTPEAKDRRDKAHIPEGLPFRTKPRIAAELVRAVAVLGTVVLDWIVADEEYGRAGHFLDELEALEQRYVVEVPVTTTVWTADPATLRPRLLGAGPRADGTGPGRRADGGGAGRRVARLRLAVRCRCARGRPGRWSSSSRRCGSGRCGTASPARRPGC